MRCCNLTLTLTLTLTLILTVTLTSTLTVTMHDVWGLLQTLLCGLVVKCPLLTD